MKGSVFMSFIEILMVIILVVTLVSRILLKKSNKKINFPDAIYWILTILILAGSFLEFCDLSGEVIFYLNQNIRSNFSSSTEIPLVRVMFVIGILCVQFFGYFLNDTTKSPLLTAVILFVPSNGLSLLTFGFVIEAINTEVSILFLPIFIGFSLMLSSLAVAKLSKNDPHITDKETSEKIKKFCMAGISIGALVMILSAFVIAFILILLK